MSSRQAGRLKKIDLSASGSWENRIGETGVEWRVRSAECGMRSDLLS
jgi:hypothetical protein